MCGIVGQVGTIAPAAVAEAWNEARIGPRWDAALKLSGLLLPVGFAVAVALAGPRVGPMHSQKALIAAYVAARTNDTQRLVYLGETPQSAEFYARGGVANAASPAELNDFLGERRGDFYALTEEQRATLPDARSHLVPLGQYGRYTLLRDAAERETALKAEPAARPAGGKDR